MASRSRQDKNAGSCPVSMSARTTAFTSTSRRGLVSSTNFMSGCFSGLRPLALTCSLIARSGSRTPFRSGSSPRAPNVGQTGFVMSVPIVAPTLYDVILTNNSASDKPTVYVALLAQDI